ncbi:MAG: trypsin-like peptidase domain-containing protein [Desulfobacterales bacterium]|nr:trypsin-like peptidase domain-containing protein [Desulfobacterales bacterium]
MKFIGWLCMLLVPAWGLLTHGTAHGADNERTVSMPVSETEAVITPWLESNGFEVYRVKGDPQEVHLEADKPGTRWRITLKAHSPLATRISTQEETSQANPPLSAFWEYLEGYVKMPSSTGRRALRATPDQVHSQLNAVVCLFTDRGGTPAQLSGFAIDREGLIVSTAHDLKPGQELSVQFRDGSESTGRVVKLDAYRDLCLIQVPHPLEHVIALRNGRYTPGGDDPLFAVGCPRAGLGEIESGVLDGPPRRVDGLPLWQARMHIEPGSSGSPVFDEHGRLAAVVKGRYRGTNAVGFLIPFETLLHFLESY